MSFNQNTQDEIHNQINYESEYDSSEYETSEYDSEDDSDNESVYSNYDDVELPEFDRMEKLFLNCAGIRLQCNHPMFNDDSAGKIHKNNPNELKWIINNFRKDFESGFYMEFKENEHDQELLEITNDLKRTEELRRIYYSLEFLDDFSNSLDIEDEKRLSSFEKIVECHNELKFKATEKEIKRTKNQLNEEIIAAALHPNRLMKKMEHFDDMEDFFNNL